MNCIRRARLREGNEIWIMLFTMKRKWVVRVSSRYALAITIEERRRSEEEIIWNISQSPSKFLNEVIINLNIELIHLPGQPLARAGAVVDQPVSYRQSGKLGHIDWLLPRSLARPFAFLLVVLLFSPCRFSFAFTDWVIDWGVARANQAFVTLYYRWWDNGLRWPTRNDIFSAWPGLSVERVVDTRPTYFSHYRYLLDWMYSRWTWR